MLTLKYTVDELNDFFLKVMEKSKDIDCEIPEWVTDNHLYQILLTDKHYSSYALSDLKGKDYDDAFQSILAFFDENNDEFALIDKAKEIKPLEFSISEDTLMSVLAHVKSQASLLSIYLTLDSVKNHLEKKTWCFFEVFYNTYSDTTPTGVIIDGLSQDLAGADYPSWNRKEQMLFKQKLFLNNQDVAMEFVIAKFKEKGQTVATAESITGGRLQALFTRTPGSSDVFLGGITAYSINNKVELLGVDREKAAEVNCVSDFVAHEMAIGAKNQFDSFLSIATTGYEMEYEFNDEILSPVTYVCFKTETSENVFKIGGELYAFGSTREGRIQNLSALIMTTIIDTLNIE